MAFYFLNGLINFCLSKLIIKIFNDYNFAIKNTKDTRQFKAGVLQVISRNLVEVEQTEKLHLPFYCLLF